MPVIINPSQEHELKYEDSTFKITAMTGRQMLQLSSALNEVSSDPSVIYDVLHTVLKSWQGIQNPAGEEVPCTPENIDSLPVEVAAKIFEFASSLSGLSEADEGN